MTTSFGHLTNWQLSPCRWERIRILNIDPPDTENRAPCNAERRLAARATMTLTEIIMGHRLEIQRDGKDRFGRTLAYIRISGADVG
jgi:micrococcal nuclease